MPTAALWETSEDRVEIIVKDRETSLLRAKRREYVRAACHVLVRHHRLLMARYMNRWHLAKASHSLGRVVDQLLKQYQKSSAAAHLVMTAGATRNKLAVEQSSVRRMFSVWVLVTECMVTADAAQSQAAVEQQEAERVLEIRRLETEHAAVTKKLTSEKQRYQEQSTALQEEVAELGTELEELYDRHGHVKRQLLLLRHSTGTVAK